MFIPSTAAKDFTIGSSTTGKLYPSSPKGDQTIATVEMDGRYPAKGFSINETCTETLLLLDGSVTVTYGDEIFKLNPGDEIILLPGKKYSVEGKGHVVDCITPAWDSAQNKIIET